MGRFKQFLLNEAQDRIFYHGSASEFDKFDMNKVGSGDGLNKYGYGIYFADNEDLARFYANELSLGGKPKYIYQVRLYRLDDFLPWDEQIPEYLYIKIANKLDKLGHDNMAQTMREELESYQETYTMDQMYDLLRDTIGEDKKVTEFLNVLGVEGVIADDIQGRGKIYVAFSSDVINIQDTLEENTVGTAGLRLTENSFMDNPWERQTQQWKRGPAVGSISANL